MIRRLKTALLLAVALLAPAVASAQSGSDAPSAVEAPAKQKRGGDAREAIPLPPELESVYEERALAVDVNGPRWKARPLRDRESAMTPEEFFEALGRPDLTEAYDSNRIVRYALITSGGLLTLAGIGALLYPLFDGCELLGSPRCGPTEMLTAVAALSLGPVVAGVGVRMVIGGLIWNASPISSAEARILADQHNRKLRSGLLAPSSSRDGPLLQLGLDLGRNGGGLSLALRF